METALKKTAETVSVTNTRLSCRIGGPENSYEVCRQEKEWVLLRRESRSLSCHVFGSLSEALSELALGVSRAASKAPGARITAMGALDIASGVVLSVTDDRFARILVDGVEQWRSLDVVQALMVAANNAGDEAMIAA